MASDSSGQRPWPGLPQDLLCLVAQRLYLPDQVRMRAVCRNWRLSTPCFSKLPWVFSYCLSPHHITCSLSIPYRENPYINLEEEAEELLMFRAPACASRCGWVLFCSGSIRQDPNSVSNLLHHGNQYCVYNPQTKDVIPLPILDLPQEYYPCEQLADFSSSPTSPGCTFVVLSSVYGNDHELVVSTYHVGDETWGTRKINMYDYNTDTCYLRAGLTAFMEGRFYYYDWWGGVLSSLEIATGEWSLLSRKPPGRDNIEIYHLRNCNTYLVAYGGHLDLVCLYLGVHGRVGCDVYRYEWDWVDEEGEGNNWRRMESLEGGALFLGNPSVGVSAGDDEETKRVGNRVYYKPYRAFNASFLMYGPPPESTMDSSWGTPVYNDQSWGRIRPGRYNDWMWMEPPSP